MTICDECLQRGKYRVPNDKWYFENVMHCPYLDNEEE